MLESYKESLFNIHFMTSPLRSIEIPTFNIMASSHSNSPTSTLKYLPSHRRHKAPQLYLTYEDLYAKYSPLNSPSLRMPYIQRCLSAEDLYQRFQKHGIYQGNPSGNRYFQSPDAQA